MLQYEFDFSRLTVGDGLALASGDIEQVVSVIDNLVDVDVWQLPMAELTPLLTSFASQLEAWVSHRSYEAAKDDDDEPLSDEWREMLSGIDGLYEER